MGQFEQEKEMRTIKKRRSKLCFHPVGKASKKLGKSGQVDRFGGGGGHSIFVSLEWFTFPGMPPDGASFTLENLEASKWDEFS